MRYRGGRSSIGGMLTELVFSEVLNSIHKSNWRIGNDINQCKLCGKCEAVCSRNALNVNPISKTWTLNNRLCNQCLACVVACPARSLTQVKL